MRIAELMALGNCAVCGKKQLEGAIPVFYVVEVSRHGFDAHAVRRAAGLEVQLGPLAAVMGPDEHLTQEVEPPHRVFVHESCASDVGHLLKLIPSKDEARDAQEA